MRILLRHLLLAALPLVLGVAAGQGFWLTQKQSCSRLVGPLFSAKCHGRQLEYQSLFQTVGTATGSVLAALVGGWLELRRRRVRSEEDTSELQSRPHLVCRLLLEKKKRYNWLSVADALCARCSESRY